MDADRPDEPSLTRKTVLGTAWLMLWRVVARSLGLLSTLILARLLLPADFGLVAMATSFSTVVESLSQLRLQEALVRRREDGFDLHHAAFTMQFGQALTAGLVIAAGAPVAAWWFTEPRLVPIVLVLSGVAIANGLENVGVAEFRRAMDYHAQFKLMSLPRLASFLVVVACALVWRSYWALLAGIVASTLVRVALSYRLHPFRPRVRLARWRELMRYSSWRWATVVVSIVWDRCDPFVLGPALGPGTLAVYLLALEIALLPVTEVVIPATDVLFAAFARAQKDGESSVSYAPKVAAIVMIGCAPLVLAISAVSGPIVEVMLGAKWAAAWPVVAVLSWACLFSPFGWICGTALVANGFVERNFVANVIMSAFKLAVLVTTISLTTDLVAIGAATAACIAVESLMFTTVLYGSGKVRLAPVFGSLARATAALALAAGVVNWTGLAWQPGLGAAVPNLLRGFTVGAVGSSVFGAALLLLWWASGRPEGAERRLLRLLASRLGSSATAQRLRTAL